MLTISEGLARIRNIHNIGVYRSPHTGQWCLYYPEDRVMHSVSVWDDIEDAVINAGRMRRERNRLCA